MSRELRHLFCFDRNLVVTRLFVAVADQTFLFRGFFEQERRATLGTGFRNRFVPHHEVTVRILQASVEHLTTLRSPFDQLTAAAWLRTRHTDGLRLDVLALRIIAARNELSEPAFPEFELRLAALRTRLIQFHVRFL